jgi:hypothetical protein
MDAVGVAASSIGFTPVRLSDDLPHLEADATIEIA